MSIETTNVVDFVNISDDRRAVYISISDHLDWMDNEGRHLELLQKKLNSYLSFLESGEIWTKFPEAKGMEPVINIVMKYNPSSEGNKFLSIARDIIEKAGFGFRVELRGGGG